MKFFQIKNFFFITLCLVPFFRSVGCFAAKLQYNIYNAIAQENTKSLNSADAAAGVCASLTECNQNGFKAFLISSLDRQMHPNEDSRQRLVFKLLSEFYDKNPSPRSTVMDEITWQDLNILCGPKSNPRMHLASKITSGRTLTAIGTATIFRMLVQPTANINKLRTQQAITRELIKNELLFNELDAKLKELVIPENMLLSFWDPEDIFSLLFEQNKTKIPFDDQVAILKQVSEFINKSPATLELCSRTQDLFGYMSKCLVVYGAVALPIYALSRYEMPGLSVKKLNVIAPFTVLWVMAWMANKVNQKFNNRLFTQNMANGTSGIAATYGYAKATYDAARDMNDARVLFECFHRKTFYLAKYLNNLKEMEKFVAQHPDLVSKMPVLQNFTQLLNNMKNAIPDFKSLIDLLETNTFKTEYSWLTYFSRVMVVYKLMREQKELFINTMLAVGELDAQLTIAKLYKEFQGKRVTFCFPEFIESSKNPIVCVQDSWNPFLDPEKAVSNSIEIGCSGIPQNVIITGPNAGGKSTVTKALIFSFILGQTLGIAPAKALAFTPASILMTYLNVIDDFAAGISHYKACVIRSLQLLEASQKLKSGEFGVFAVDEAFDGTAFKEAQAAAFTLIEELGMNPAVMCITNTHFPLIPKLEETGLFQNYKVSVIDVPGQKIVYPYKLEPGISHQNVALKILEEEGFGDDFVRRAQRLV
ncbi:MAG: hypothetical protein V1646_02310 [bacterium]